MTSLLPGSRITLPNIAAWLDRPWPFVDYNPVRIEEITEGGTYTVRAELPGFDPENHISVTTHDGLLTVEAEREERKHLDGRSEFAYGKFSRTVQLPAGAVTGEVTARYVDGILEISMPLAGQPHENRVKIEVQ
ncbi:Hsp20/alpha crystallin family protein [Amycolatopsis sp. GA6-003]|uniref:Hsp20/alpha crystallin family protein n=1 Tax=Amycolatopsis sp. GA6-003 TaxID=2652444 RepID=UPI00391708F4